MNVPVRQRQPLRILNQMIDSIGPGMLTSIDGRGLLISRPMTPLELDGSGDLWFFIRASSLNASASALAADPAATYPVNIAFAQPDEASYVSVTGVARLLRDPQREDRLWSPEIRIWFAQGKNDPDLALLRVEIVEADYWDARAAAMVQLFPAPETD